MGFRDVYRLDRIPDQADGCDSIESGVRRRARGLESDEGYELCAVTTALRRLSLPVNRLRTDELSESAHGRSAVRGEAVYLTRQVQLVDGGLRWKDPRD